MISPWPSASSAAACWRAARWPRFMPCCQGPPAAAAAVQGVVAAAGVDAAAAVAEEDVAAAGGRGQRKRVVLDRMGGHRPIQYLVQSTQYLILGTAYKSANQAPENRTFCRAKSEFLAANCREAQ